MIRNLRSEDYLSVIAFDDVAEPVIPLQQISSKQSAIEKIQKIDTRGSTNLTAGWMLGRDELKKSPEGVSRKILLLSDGQLNRGVIEPEQVKRVVASGIEIDRIKTSSLGFGEGYNEDLLADLAQCSNGAFYDANSADSLPAIFTEELEGLQKIVCQNVRIRIRKETFCESFEQLGNYPVAIQGDGSIEMMIGDLVSEEERTLVFGLEVLPLPLLPGGHSVTTLQGEALIHLEIIYDQIGEKEIASKQFAQMIRVLPIQNPEEIKINESVIPLISAQRAGKTVEEVIADLDHGRVEEAKAKIQRLRESLSRYGSEEWTKDARALLDRVMERVDQGNFNSAARKMSKYASRSYRNMSSSTVWTAEVEAPTFSKKTIIKTPELSKEKPDSNQNGESQDPHI